MSIDYIVMALMAIIIFYYVGKCLVTFFKTK